jgi:glycosyltransferase involved in cell wall biosynthesis
MAEVLQFPSAGVAMCVYNGARHLSHQLASIAAQDMLPSRMVVLDDGSNDGTWEMLRAWAASAPFPVEVQRNPQQLGVVRNFERACALLDTDLVVLCDQDDVWYPNKLRTLVSAFHSDTALTLLHSDADLIDDDGAPLGRRLFDTLLVTGQERQLVSQGDAWRVYVKRNLVTGAACAFRRTLLDAARPFSTAWVHDEWLAFHAALVGKVGLFPEPLMAYRLHGGNTVGFPVPTLAWRVRSTVHAFTQPTAPRQRARAERLDEIANAAHRLGAPGPVLEHLALAAGHARFRAELPRNPLTRLRRIWRERSTGHYHAWSNGPVSMLHDLLIAR